MTDTSKEAVERLAYEIVDSLPRSPNSYDAATTLRALFAENEALRALQPQEQER